MKKMQTKLVTLLFECVQKPSFPVAFLAKNYMLFHETVTEQACYLIFLSVNHSLLYCRLLHHTSYL